MANDKRKRFWKPINDCDDGLSLSDLMRLLGTENKMKRTMGRIEVERKRTRKKEQNEVTCSQNKKVPKFLGKPSRNGIGVINNVDGFNVAEVKNGRGISIEEKSEK